MIPDRSSAPHPHRTATVHWPRRVLVVEDDRFARQVLVDALSGRGFQVVTAEDGLSGAERLLEELMELDVLVTDVQMPGMGGAALIDWVRNAGGERDLPIVVVSGAERDEARLRAAGADAVLGKEAGFDAIAEAIDQIAGGRPPPPGFPRGR